MTPPKQKDYVDREFVINHCKNATYTNEKTVFVRFLGELFNGVEYFIDEKSELWFFSGSYRTNFKINDCYLLEFNNHKIGDLADCSERLIHCIMLYQYQYKQDFRILHHVEGKD